MILLRLSLCLSVSLISFSFALTHTAIHTNTQCIQTTTVLSGGQYAGATGSPVINTLATCRHLIDSPLTGPANSCPPPSVLDGGHYQ